MTEKTTNPYLAALSEAGAAIQQAGRALALATDLARANNVHEAELNALRLAALDMRLPLFVAASLVAGPGIPEGQSSSELMHSTRVWTDAVDEHDDINTAFAVVADTRASDGDFELTMMATAHMAFADKLDAIAATGERGMQTALSSAFGDAGERLGDAHTDLELAAALANRLGLHDEEREARRRMTVIHDDVMGFGPDTE